MNEHLETEDQLVDRAKTAVSDCNWTVGECAARWTKRFARGRTDADFGALVGLSGDQVFQRRRVWETFSDVQQHYPSLRWSHFYVAINWDDAAECLQWAEETQSTVAEMRAWRRMQRGEDLTVAADDDLEPSQLPTEPTPVRPPGPAAPVAGGQTVPGGGGEPREATVAAAARESDQPADAGYAPFREGAGRPAPQPEAETPRKPQQAPPEQVLKRMTAAIERCNAALDAGLAEQFPQLPEPLRERFLQSVRRLAKTAAELS